MIVNWPIKPEKKFPAIETAKNLFQDNNLYLKICFLFAFLHHFKLLLFLGLLLLVLHHHLHDILHLLGAKIIAHLKELHNIRGVLEALRLEPGQQTLLAGDVDVRIGRLLLLLRWI